MNFTTDTNTTPTTPAARLALADKPNFPEEYGTLKRTLVPFEHEAAVIKSWADLLQALDAATKEIAQKGSDIIPQVEFSDLTKLSAAQKVEIRRIGAVAIRNVVDDEEALKWKEDLKQYVKANPRARGYPEENKQMFELYWSKSQVAARAHPNVIKVQAFLNALWSEPTADALVSYSTPVVYADRVRIRQADGQKWGRHPPHIDGANIERWADDTLRSSFAGILKGDWKEHDPYVIDGRITGKSRFALFRCWQGWLAMSNTGPGEGTLKVFPNVQLSNAYILLRPFFRLKSPEADPFVADSWIFDAKTSHFPGLQPSRGMRPDEFTHPNLKTDTNMTSMPRVQPGDMVFWHCDVIHSVEEEHNGPNDSSVIYIPAAPLTLRNALYVARQRETFLAGNIPPDYPAGTGEEGFTGRATEDDVRGIAARSAMGFESFPVTEGMSQGEKDLLREASRLIAI